MSDKAIYKLYPQVVSINNGIEAFDAKGNLVAIDMDLIAEEDAKLSAQQKIDDCKNLAKQKLSNSDWAVLPDVNITNRAEFEAYRVTIRNLVLNPVADPVFPTEPQPVWG